METPPVETPSAPPKQEEPKAEPKKNEPHIEALKSALAAAEQGDTVATLAHARRVVLLLDPGAGAMGEEPREDATRRRTGFSRFRKTRTPDSFR